MAGSAKHRASAVPDVPSRMALSRLSSVKVGTGGGGMEGTSDLGLGEDYSGASRNTQGSSGARKKRRSSQQTEGCDNEPRAHCSPTFLRYPSPAENEFSAEEDELACIPVKSTLRKYWNQRYNLFSRFDEGIELDDESWYSVTPELIARHIAARCVSKNDIVLDPFCGAGGNVIQFAQQGCQVIAIDIDPRKVCIAKKNAAVYDVDSRIHFINGDAFRLLPFFRGVVDVVFLSPPWGGPAYGEEGSDGLLAGMNANWLLSTALEVTPKVAFLLPRNVTRDSMIELVDGLGRDGENGVWLSKERQPKSFELESNFLFSRSEAARNPGRMARPKTKTAYFGTLIKNSKLPEVGTK